MRLSKVSILAVLALAAPAYAAPAAAPAPRHNPAPTRATTPTPTPVPLKVAAVKPAPTKPVPAPAAAMPVAPAPAAADELIVEYQRVGHEIVLLQRLRGTEAAADLWEALHEIDLDKGFATADGRANAALTFAELHDKIERRRGVQISKACQDNVITADCQ